MGWRPWPVDVGRPRVYEPDDPPTLYPGEQMRSAGVDLAALQREAVRHDLERVPIRVRWEVTPTPGVAGWWLRWRYRLIGWWWPGGAARLHGRVER